MRTGELFFCPFLHEYNRYFEQPGGLSLDYLYGVNPILAIVSHIFFIGVTFYALQAVLPSHLIKKNHVFQAQILFILVSIAIGWAVSNFFLEISYWSGRIPYFFM